MDDFDWIKDIMDQSTIQLTNNTDYAIILCNTSHKTKDLRPKFIELFGTDYANNKGIVNWFNNSMLKGYENRHGGVILCLHIKDGKINGGWDSCNELYEYENHKQLSPEDFLYNTINPNKFK